MEIPEGNISQTDASKIENACIFLAVVGDSSDPESDEHEEVDRIEDLLDGLFKVKEFHLNYDDWVHFLVSSVGVDCAFLQTGESCLSEGMNLWVFNDPDCLLQSFKTLFCLHV